MATAGPGGAAGYPWWSTYAAMPWWYYGDSGYPAATYTVNYASPAVANDFADNTPIETPIETPAEGDYSARALEAFHEGSYQNAFRLAGHAAVDSPRDPNVHLLLSLSMFASGITRARPWRLMPSARWAPKSIGRR